ncbi:MAG: ComEA family DNA-binding protein [Dehalococcoidia bacterium]
MSRWLDRYKAIIVIMLVVIILAGGALLLYKHPWDKGPLEIVLSEPSCRVTVCVLGEVESPGIYVLDDCSLCIQDAVDAAGGFTQYADEEALNPTAPLNNGDLIYVARLGDVPQRVNLNTAGAWLLEALPGIGPTLAGRVVEYRSQNGPFKNAEELMMVEGIGQAKYDGLKDLVTLD